jgi:DNA mismatch repair ATPase MutS
MEYISVKEATVKYNKSISTIKRLVAKTPQKNLKKGVKLNSGRYKTLIEVSYLDKYFNVSKSISNDSTNEMLDALIKELDNKQKTIESLLQRQEETNHSLNKAIENEERFQILLERSNQRANLLEQHFNKNKGNKSDLVQEEEIIEDIIEAKEDTIEESSFIDTNDEEGFTNWLKTMKNN